VIGILKSYVDVLFPIATVILGFVGLRTWKIQLKGGSKYNLAADTLREYHFLKEEIRRYRLTAYRWKDDIERYSEIIDKIDIDKIEKTVEHENWKHVIEQLGKYRSCLIKLKISINDYTIDLVEGDKISLVDVVIGKLDGARVEREFLNDSAKYSGQIDKEQQRLILDRRERIFSVLCKGLGDDDEIEKILEKNFELINSRLRRYL